LSNYDSGYPYAGKRDFAAPGGWSDDGASIGSYDSDKANMWYSVLQPYIKSEQVLVCPSATKIPLAVFSGNFQPYDGSVAGYIGYGYNAAYIGAYSPRSAVAEFNRPARESQLGATATTVLAFDSGGGNGGNRPPFRANASGVLSSKVFEADPPTTNTRTNDDPVPPDRHLGTVNVLFCDGHVKALKKDALLYNPAATGTRDFETSEDPKMLWNRL